MIEPPMARIARIASHRHNARTTVDHVSVSVLFVKSVGSLLRKRVLGSVYMRATVQISLDLLSIDESLATAEMALRAGVDWLEAGTPLIIAHGMHGVRALRERFPKTPIVADLKTMDGGYLEAEVMAKAGATHVVVMARAHEETVRCVVQAGRDFGVKVMGDNLGCEDMVAGARQLEDLGCDYVIHHIGYDERRGIAARGERMPSPLDQLREVVAAVSVPVQAVGGLTLEQAVRAPEYGAPLVVLGAPLVIDADAFKTASGNLEDSLRMICEKVHGYGDVPVGRRTS
jgi:3-hexulose-6-phosphate synthase